MTPKNKAKELFDKLWEIAEVEGSFDADNCAKKCALIVVDEIMLVIQDEFTCPPETAQGTYKYWDKVKKEIEKL